MCRKLLKELFSTRTVCATYTREVTKPLSTAAARAWWVTNHQRGGWQQHWDLQTTRTRGCRSSVRPRSSVTSLTCPHRSRRVTDRRTGGGWGRPPPSELCLLLVHHSTATARLGGFDMSRYWDCESSQYSPDVVFCRN